MKSKKFVITVEMQIKWERAARRAAEIESGLIRLNSPRVHRTHKKDQKRNNNVDKRDI